MKVDTLFLKSGEHLTHQKYRADIDGLRSIAVLSVVGFHAFPNWIKGGFVGVDIFFVISGFLISTIVFGNFENSTFSYKEFYARRVRRIFPALVVVVLFCILAGWWILFSDDYRLLGKHVLSGNAFVTNLILLRESGYFDKSVDEKPLLHLWSLAVEEQFYIFWPILLGLVWARRWNFLFVTVSVAVLSFLTNIFLVEIDQSSAFYSPLPRFWELMIGGILAHLSLHRPGLVGRFRNLQSFVGAALLGVGFLFITKDKLFPGWWALLPSVGAVLVISAGPEAWVNKNILSRRIFVWFGLISYPLYLWHWPLLSFSLLYNIEQTSALIRGCVVVASIALAWVTYRYLELPVRRGSVRTGYIIWSFVFTGLLAAGIVFSDGFSERAVNKDEQRLFVHSYSDFHKHGLANFYQEKCDFYDWGTGANKGKISSECTEFTGGSVRLLWGDSHAQALSFGLRRNIPQGVNLAQIATSGCSPKIHLDNLNP